MPAISAALSKSASCTSTMSASGDRFEDSDFVTRLNKRMVWRMLLIDRQFKACSGRQLRVPDFEPGQPFGAADGRGQGLDFFTQPGQFRYLSEIQNFD